MGYNEYFFISPCKETTPKICPLFGYICYPLIPLKNYTPHSLLLSICDWFASSTRKFF